jgi:heme A synthase
VSVASPPAERAAASSRGASPPRWFGPSDRTPSRGLRVLAVLTAINTYAIIVMGGIVRTTGSGEGCDAPGDNGWPLCQGRLLPPWQQHAVIEFTHRWLVASMTVLLIAFSATVVLRYRHRRRLVAGVVAVAVLLVVQIALGAITIQYHLSGSIVMAHLANAEVLLGVLIWTVLQVFHLPALRGGAPGAAATRWMAVAAAATFVLVLSGAFVVAQGAGAACNGWPLCGGVTLSGDQLATYNLGHSVVAGAVTVLLGVGVMAAVRAHRGDRAVRISAGMVGLLLLAQVAAGALVVELRLPAGMRSLHEALASGLWAVTVLLALLVVPAVRQGSVAAEARLQVAVAS